MMIKNIYKKLTCLLLAVLLVTACEKDFLDTKPATSVSTADVYASAENARGVIIAIYRQMRDWMGSMNRSGLHTMALTRDCMGPDVVVQRSWYTSEVTYSAYQQSSSRVAYPFDLFYEIINYVNDLLANIDGASGTDAEINLVKAEAYALRGFSYFELVRRYQHTYSIAQNMPGVPIYNEPTTAETLGNPRSTVQEVYTQILADLTQAKSGMTAARNHKGHFNIDVVNGILARVYLTMEDWTNAISHAQAARANYPLMSGTAWVEEGFYDVGNAEWIWGQNNNLEENPDWGSAINLLDPDGAEFPFTTADTLTAAYSATDVRGMDITTDADGKNWNYKITTFGRYEADYPLMRSAEMYLIEAEAMAKNVNETGAQDALYAIQFRADPNAVKSTNTGQSLIDEILWEKRKEFWGEGVVFWDMLRNQQPLVRDVNHTAKLYLPANSWEFIFPIPEQEFMINENLDIATDQNPATGVYIP